MRVILWLWARLYAFRAFRPRTRTEGGWGWKAELIRMRIMHAQKVSGKSCRLKDALDICARCSAISQPCRWKE